MSRPIRVALSGSGFRLGAHIGALQAITDAGFEIKEIAGTSGGSIVAAMFASGMTLGAMQVLAATMDWSPMMRFSLWTALTTRRALSTGSALLDFLTAHTDGKTFADLAVDLKIIASDMVTEDEFRFSRETTPTASIAMAARASASIPLVFEPVEYAGAALYDGGMCDNIPASALTVDDVPRVGIYLQSNDPPLIPGRRSLGDLAPRMIDMLLASNEKSIVSLDTKCGALIIPVETAYASSFDKHMPLALRTRLFRDGYTVTRAAIANL